MVLVLLAAVIAVGIVGGLVRGAFEADPARAAVAAVAAVGLALPHLAFLLWLDRNDPEPAMLLALAFAWGAVLATCVSLFANITFGELATVWMASESAGRALTASVSAPIVEETTKGAAVLAMFFLFPRHFDNVVDGLVYGAIGVHVAWNTFYPLFLDPGQTGAHMLLVSLPVAVAALQGPFVIVAKGTERARGDGAPAARQLARRSGRMSRTEP